MKKFTIYAFAVLPMVFWSMTFIWYKIVLEYIGPVSVTFFRLILASLILMVVTKYFIKTKEKLVKKDYLYLLLLSFFEPFIYFMGESFGMQYVSPTIAAVIISTIPVVTPVFAFRILNERLNIYNIVGLTLSFAGVVIIIVNPSSSADFTVKGIMLLLMAVMGAVGYGITVKKLAANYSSLTITKYQSIIGCFLFMPFYFVFEHRTTVQNIGISVSDGTFSVLILTLVQMSLFASVMAFVLIIRPIREIGISKTNVFTNLIPVFTAVISYFYLKESFDIQKILGISVVISGIVMSQIKGVFRKKTLQIM